jgi:hypothetical protein
MTLNNQESRLFSFPDEADYLRFRDVLYSANFTEAGINDAVGIQGFKSVDMALLLYRTRAGSALDTFIRLFLLEIPVDVQAAREAIKPMRLETLTEAGIFEIEGEFVLSTVSLRPGQGLLFAFDLSRRLHSPEGANYVMGFGPSSLSLANLTVRNPSRLTLDLGTGCGTQALMAAGHSDMVIAADLNPRALSLTNFNARLNGFSNVECREGNLFEPVEGCTFDLIVSNPPFVISPEMHYIFRDSGMSGDEVCEKIAREAPRFLSEGGCFQMLCNWVEYAGRDWRERIAGWFEGSGCDVWVLNTKRDDTATYASHWIKHTEKDTPQQHLRRFEEWMKYYAQLGIEAVGGGIINVRRSSAHRAWFQTDEIPDDKAEAGGDAILLGFELYDFLQTVQDDGVLLETRLHTSPHVALKSLSVPSPGGWSGTALQLTLSRGLAFTANIDGPMANFVPQCDGRRTLGELMLDMSVSMRVDPAGIASDFCSLVRRLLSLGFLLPPHLVKIKDSQ